MREITRKMCISCGDIKPMKSFYKSKRYLDGYMSRCKECYKNSIFKDKDYPSFGAINIAQIDKDSFNDMNEVLSSMQYDTSKDIHQQFIERMASKYGVNFDYVSEAEDKIWELKKKLKINPQEPSVGER